MNEKSGLCKGEFPSPPNIGVARHSIVGNTVYEASLRVQVMKNGKESGDKNEKEDCLNNNQKEVKKIKVRTTG